MTSAHHTFGSGSGHDTWAAAGPGRQFDGGLGADETRRQGGAFRLDAAGPDASCPAPWSSAYAQKEFVSEKPEDRQLREDLQWAVFERLLRLGRKHTEKAWALRYKKPLGAFAFAFLFRQPGDPAQVLAATRIWKAGPESASAIGLLQILHRQVVGQLDLLAGQFRRIDGLLQERVRLWQQSYGLRRTGEQENTQRWLDSELQQLARVAPWDFREELADRGDDGLSGDAVYLGLGVSSLDTPGLTFTQACQQAGSELDLSSGLLFISAVDPRDPRDDATAALGRDDHVLLADRRKFSDYPRLVIRSYQALTTSWINTPYQYAEVSRDTLLQDPFYGPLLPWMRQLDGALRYGDQLRRGITGLQAAISVRRQGNAS